MKPIKRKPLSKRLGSALVMTLVIIVLITVVTVGYLASVMLETKTAGSALDQERAYGVAMIGVHEAMSRVRDALGPWDNPYKNFAVTNPPFYWSVSPGRLTQWAYADTSSVKIPLFSGVPGYTDVVNLNRQLSDGSYPIISETNAGETIPPDISVRWVNLPRDPSRTADSNNPIIGRYAFWVDNEGSKINVNTADGTAKYKTNSLGIGSPSEVSLQVLAGTSGQLSLSNAQSIVQIARTSNFQSPREILRASGVTPDVYTNNVFSLTAYSRSPELNVFGQPKMALLPLLGTALVYDSGNVPATNMVINGITLRPGNEIYPTPSQLTNYSMRNPITSNSVAVPWPLAFRAEATQSLGRYQEYRQFGWMSVGTNYCYINGALLANYLAGTNAAGRPISWPAFPGTSATNFQQKYSKRQIDSIVAQIVSLGSKLISSDFPHPASTNYPASMKISDGAGDMQHELYLEQKGCRYNNAPYLFPGWLSGEFVIGMGRSVKLSGLKMRVSAFGSQGTLGDATNEYIPPKAKMDIWLEWWLPSGYSGGSPISTNPVMLIGHNSVNRGALNRADITPATGKSAPLPKDPFAPSHWANQLLTNDQGIDFACNPDVAENGTKDFPDPDQDLAELHHAPYAQYPDYPAAPQYYIGQGGPFHAGTSTGFRTPLRVSNPVWNSEFSPGEVRSVGSMYYSAGMPMRVDAVGSKLNVGGGIAVRSELVPGHFSDPDPVPLEAIRGAGGVSVNAPDLDTWEPITGAPDWQMFTITGETLRQRVVKSVIPLGLSVDVPPHGDASTGISVEILVAPDDPLVNKFPGDWKPRNWNTIQSPPLDRMSGTNANYATYNESTTSWYKAPNFDPDSFWLPRMDVPVSRLSDIPDRTEIPRSARMPNIGYLQYVRTGIIPDDESVPYEQQQGTPFRLLSYAPSQNQTKYPDWAMLDLLYIPSTLSPYGSPYNPSTAVPLSNSAATNLAFFGTYGGATAGRVNPNGVVIYTTNVNSPQTNVSRKLPMRAVLHGLTVNGGNPVDEAAIADAIETYLRDPSRGALRMPAEICNVPAIDALRASINPTRNDLVRQIVGALTTQDNIFSVWAVGQAIQKKRGNPQYDRFEAGDNVLAEVRLRFIVERYLDPGADSVYGNSTNPGTDAVVGTYDDPSDPANHPFQPRYLYRVVASEEAR